MEQILINLIAGAFGGSATGKSSPTNDLGTVGNIGFRAVITLGPTLLLLAMMAVSASAQVPPPAYSCCERGISLPLIKAVLVGAPRHRNVGATLILEADFKLAISFECQPNLGNQCIGAFDVALQQSPMQDNGTGAFTVAPGPATATIVGYPQFACDGRKHNDFVYVRWTATYPTQRPVVGDLILRLTMPPGSPADKGNVDHTLATLGWYNGTGLVFSALGAPTPQVPDFTCCESNVALGPQKPAVKNATSTDMGAKATPAALVREVRIVTTVPISFDCGEGAAGQRCIGRFTVAVARRPQQGAGAALVDPIFENVQVTGVSSKACGSGHQTGDVEVEWRGVYPATTPVTGTLQLTLTTPAAKGGLNRNLNVPNVNADKGKVTTGAPTTP